MSVLKFILGVLLRFAIFTWLYIIIGLFSDLLLPESGITAENFYSVGAIILFLAIFMTYLKYDQRILTRFIAIKGVLPIIAGALILVWVVIFFTWFNSIDGFQDVESFMYYEIVLLVLGFPSSIIGVILRSMLSPILEMLYQTPDKGSIIELRQDVIFIWIFYFVPFLIQLYLLGRYLTRKPD